MSTPTTEVRCRNCQRPFPREELDQYDWCDGCRAVVIRRATIAGRIAGILGAFAVGYWIFGVLDPDPRFLIFWIVVVGVVYGFLYKIVQRVSFEIIRSRGVPPATEG